MTTNPVTAGPLMTFEGAARLMRDHDIGALPVIKDGRLIGIVTDRDMIVRGMAEGRDGFLSRISDVMTADVLCASAEDELADAAATMARHRIRRLPVTDLEGRLVGIVALADISHHSEDEAGFVLAEISEPAAQDGARAA